MIIVLIINNVEKIRVMSNDMRDNGVINNYLEIQHRCPIISNK